MFSTELKLQVVLLTVQAFMFLVLAGWCLRRVGAGRWAGMGATGAALLGLAFGTQAASAVEVVFFQTQHIDRTLFIHPHFHTVLYAAQAVGALVLAGAFVESRRTPADATTSIYGG